MVDILLATYNGALFLEEQLNSLLEQTHKDIHIYVRDDCSTDETPTIINNFIDKYPNIFTIIENKGIRLGAKNSFFELLKYSNAEYIMFCDQDDIWLKDKIDNYLKIVKQYDINLPIMIHSDLIVVDKNGNEKNNSMMKMQKLNPEYKTLNRLLAQNNVTGCTVMINKSLKKMIKNVPDVIMHDWWIALTAAAFGKIIFYPTPTVLYRQHDNNEVGVKDVSSKFYIKDKLSNIDNIKLSIKDTYNQTQAFLNAYNEDLSEESLKIAQEYIKLESANRVKKIYSMLKNGFLKNGFLRKLGQMCFG